MTIVNKSRNFSAPETYKLTKDARIEKLSDHEGELLTVTGFILYEDTKEVLDDGKLIEKTVTILSLELEEGKPVATNSATAIRSFGDILEIYSDAGQENPYPLSLVVVSGKAKSGRKYYDLSLE